MKLKTILFTLLLVAVTLSAAAQSSGDRLYSQGLTLQKKLTVASQKAAIVKFSSAKKLYDSAAKKKQCDDAIAVSQGIIKGLQKNKPGKTTHVSKEETKAVQPFLEVSNEEIHPDAQPHTMTVSITTNCSEWTAAAIPNDNGSHFLTVTQNAEENSVTITCPENTSTLQRSQKVEVRAEQLLKQITVMQDGLPTTLSVEKTVVEFSAKGGSKSIEVYSNYDAQAEENNYQNWVVQSKPEWISVVGETAKQKSVLGIKLKGQKNDNAEKFVTSLMKLVVESKSKTEGSRRGEVVIASGDKIATIIVRQD